MQNKKFIILISVVALVLAGLFGILFYYSLQKGPAQAPSPTANNLTNFGSNPSANPSPTSTESAPSSSAPTTAAGPAPVGLKLQQISALPVVGETATQEGAIEVVRYVDAGSGNIYENTINPLNETKLTDTQIFGVHDATWARDGSAVVLRYLKDDPATQTGSSTIESFLGSVTAPGVAVGLKGSFLPENITSLSSSPDGKNIFYIFASGGGVVGISSSSDGGQKSQIFNSSFSEWTADWSNARSITLTTKPSSSVNGFAYSLDPSTGVLTKLLGDVAGLTTKTSPDGKMVLYTDNTLDLKIYDVDKKISSDLGIKTLPEKCAWSSDNINIYCAVPVSLPSGDYPDSWYQGLVSFNDAIWKINTGTNAFSMLSDLSSAGKGIDGTNLVLSPKEDYLFFINKKDSVLWSLSLAL